MEKGCAPKGGGAVHIQLITKLSSVLKSKAIHQKRKKNKGKERVRKKQRGLGGYIIGSMQELIGSVANNVAVLMPSFSLECNSWCVIESH